MRDALGGYQFHEAVQALYHFFWDDFSDWYIELTKADVTAEEDTPARTEARSRLLTVLARCASLHPFMPYITEELWLQLPRVDEDLLHAAYRGAEPTIMLTAYPEARPELIDDRVEQEMEAVIDLISSAQHSLRDEHQAGRTRRADYRRSGTNSAGSI